jgi:Domain of unknown function (DUF2382)
MISDEFTNSPQSTDLINSAKINPISKTLTEEVIALLEERLIVNFTRQKVGEIVVRKEIETQVLQVQVPVRREKLIIEQVSPEYKLLSEIDLGSINGSEQAIADVINNDLESVERKKNAISIGFKQHTQPTIYRRIDSLKAVINLLEEMASMPSGDYKTFKIEIVLENLEHQDTYQALLDHHCKV